MKIVVIDGQGGGLGKALVARLSEAFQSRSDIEICAVGIHSIATAAMSKAGAHYAATGENAAEYNCSDADIIMGAMGIAFPNAMRGEITPRVARAVGSSRARKILIPVPQLNVDVVGLREMPISACVEEAVRIAAGRVEARG